MGEFFNKLDNKPQFITGVAGRGIYSSPPASRAEADDGRSKFLNSGRRQTPDRVRPATPCSSGYIIHACNNAFTVLD